MQGANIRVDVDGIPLRIGSGARLLVGIHDERGVKIVAYNCRHLLGEGGGGAFGQIADGLGVGEVVAVVSEGDIGFSSSSSSSSSSGGGGGGGGGSSSSSRSSSSSSIKARETEITNGGNNEQHMQNTQANCNNMTHSNICAQSLQLYLLKHHKNAQKQGCCRVRIESSNLYACHALGGPHHGVEDHGAVGQGVPVHGDGKHAAT